MPTVGSNAPRTDGGAAARVARRLAGPGQNERLDLAERAHVLDRVVDAARGVAGGQHRLEVVARARAPNDLERLQELADVGGLHAEHRRLLAHEERGLEGSEGAAELAPPRVAPAGPEKVHAF